ncbi:MAG: hypothetical protein ACYSR8_04155 [Planctomycetota bacterium]|jgi:hypothetical protein
MKKYGLIGIVVVICCICIAVSAENEIKPFKFRTTVKLKVSCGNKALKNQIYSYISQELRSLGDVTVVDDDESEWVYQIIAVEQEYFVGDRKKTGNVMMSLVTLRRSNLYVNLEERLNKEDYENLKKRCSSLFFVSKHDLRSTPKTALQGICKEVVAQFDVEDLEIERKVWQEMDKEHMESIKK